MSDSKRDSLSGKLGYWRSELKSAIPKLSGSDIEWLVAFIESEAASLSVESTCQPSGVESREPQPIWTIESGPITSNQLASFADISYMIRYRDDTETQSGTFRVTVRDLATPEGYSRVLSMVNRIVAAARVSRETAPEPHKCPSCGSDNPQIKLCAAWKNYKDSALVYPHKVATNCCSECSDAYHACDHSGVSPCDGCERIGELAGEAASTKEESSPALVVRCFKCKGTLIYKRINESEVEVFHTCDVFCTPEATGQTASSTPTEDE